MSARPDYENAVRKALDLIFEDLSSPAGFRNLAAEVGISAFHFHRIFSALVGESPAEVSRRLRLERAAEALLRGDSVGATALDAGFETPKAFTKAFAAKYGLSPSAAKSQSLSTTQLAAPSGLHYALGLRTTYSWVDTGETQMETSIVELDDMRVAGLEHIGPYPTIGASFQRLGQSADGRKLFAQGAPRAIGVFLDDPAMVAEENLKSLAGLIVQPSTDIGGLVEYKLSGGRFLKATHVGAYSTLNGAWGTLVSKHVVEQRVELRPEPCFEIYIVHNPQDVTKCQTELYVPIV